MNGYGDPIWLITINADKESMWKQPNHILSEPSWFRQIRWRVPVAAVGGV